MTARTEHPDLLVQYVARTLDPARTAEIARHLAACVDCRIEAEALASMRRSILSQNGSGHVGSEDLVLYEEGSLGRDPVRRARIERHLDGCPDCRSDLLALERAGRVRHSPRTRRCANWAPLAATIAALLAAPIVWSLWRSPHPVPVVQAPGLLQAEPVTLAAPRRGVAEKPVLPGRGPWSMTVLLPFGAPDGEYRLRIEREDGSSPVPLRALVATDGQGSLTVFVGSLPGAGSYRLILAPRGETDAEAFVYRFETASVGPRAADEGAAP